MPKMLLTFICTLCMPLCSNLCGMDNENVSKEQKRGRDMFAHYARKRSPVRYSEQELKVKFKPITKPDLSRTEEKKLETDLLSKITVQDIEFMKNELKELREQVRISKEEMEQRMVFWLSIVINAKRNELDELKYQEWKKIFDTANK